MPPAMPPASLPPLRRIAPALLAMALLPAAAPPDAAPPPARTTARGAVERQLAAPPTRPGTMRGEEATRIRENYLDRIGQKLVPQRDAIGGRAGS